MTFNVTCRGANMLAAVHFRMAFCSRFWITDGSACIECGVSGLFAPRYFRFRERKFPGTFAPGSESSQWELSLPGAKVLGNFRSWERKFPRTFAPWNESSQWELWLRGAKIPRSEKSWYRDQDTHDTLIINSLVNLTRQLHCSNNSVIRKLCQTLCLHVI